MVMVTTREGLEQVVALVVLRMLSLSPANRSWSATYVECTLRKPVS
jgi:hypothetical protein